MSTQPQLSPIEQLMMQGSQPQSSTQPQDQNNLSPIEQLMQIGQKATDIPGADIQPVTTSTNPKLAAAEAGKDMPEYVGAVGAGAAGAMGLSAAEPVLSALAPHLPSLQRRVTFYWRLVVGLTRLSTWGKCYTSLTGARSK